MTPHHRTRDTLLRNRIDAMGAHQQTRCHGVSNLQQTAEATSASSVAFLCLIKGAPTHLFCVGRAAEYNTRKGNTPSRGLRCLNLPTSSRCNRAARVGRISLERHECETDPAVTPSGYLLPIAAHVTLQHTRDHLRLLSQLTEARSEDDRSEIVISADALADTFGRIAQELDDVLVCAHRIND